MGDASKAIEMVLASIKRESIQEPPGLDKNYESGDNHGDTFNDGWDAGWVAFARHLQSLLDKPIMS